MTRVRDPYMLGDEYNRYTYERCLEMYETYGLYRAVEYAEERLKYTDEDENDIRKTLELFINDMGTNQFPFKVIP